MREISGSVAVVAFLSERGTLCFVFVTISTAVTASITASRVIIAVACSICLLSPVLDFEDLEDLGCFARMFGLRSTLLLALAFWYGWCGSLFSGTLPCCSAIRTGVVFLCLGSLRNCSMMLVFGVGCGIRPPSRPLGVWLG